MDKPLTILRIWKNSFSVYQKVFIRLLPFVLLLSFLQIVIHLGVRLIGCSAHSCVISARLFEQVLLLVYPWFMGIIALQTNAVIKSADESYKHSIQFASKKYFSLLLGYLLVILIIFVGTLLLIIPGIIALYIVFFYKYRILFEGEKVVASIKSSFRLVWGNWWRTFFVTFVPMLIPIVVILSFYIFGRLSQEQTLLIQICIVGPVIGIFITPFFEAVLINQYYDLKIRTALKNNRKLAR